MMDPSGSRKQQTIMANNNSPEISMAGEVFDQFCNANTLKSILGHFRQLCDLLKIKPNTITQFYPKLKAKLRSWKAQALWKKFDQRANHKCYNRGKACPNTRVLIIGGGPCGLRSAIEAQLLGAKVVVVEKRDRMSRNNVLHLWPFVIHDLRGLGAKKFFGKFCAGSIDHISIRQLQCILLKVALILGVEFHENVSFDSLVPPPDNQEDGKIGWRAKTTPADHPVSQYEFDVLIGADGKRNTLEGFKRKEFRGKLAIAITANFINKRTEAEARVEEISGVAFIFNQKFFKELYQETGIDLENIVYYKDDTHYFVMTAKKHSLIDKGVILQDHADTAKLLAKENVDREALMLYAREAAEFSTEYQMMDMEFAVNHYGQPDVAMFDFTSMYAAENASRVLERHGHRLLMILVGDSLLEPFWPTGSGCARGFLSSLDACWAIKGWGASMPPLDVIAERESIYRLLGQTTPENLNRDYAAYTLDPHTRYPNLNVSSVTPIQVRTLFDTDDPESIKQATEIDIPKKRRRRDLRGDSHVHPDTLLRWLQKQVCLYDNVKIDDMGASFKDGLAICAIIHRYRPDLIDFHRLQRDDVAQNNQLAFDILEKELGISPIMTGEEIAQCDVPDKLAMFSYLTQIYEVFRGEIPHVKHPQLELDEEERAGNSKQLTQLTGRVARQDSATRARHSRSRHNENLNPLEKKGDTTSRRSRKRRSTEKMGATVEERQRKLAEIERNRAERMRRRQHQRKMATQQFYKSMQMLRANAKREKDEPFEDYSIFLYRQTAPDFKDRVKYLEQKILYPDREPKIHVGHRRASIDEEFSGRIKNIEDKLRGSAPSEKKPRDLLRAIGKIEKTDWNVKEIEKKIEESKMGRAAKHEKVERVPKWSREQFLARQTKMERRGREQKDTDSKYADIDNTLKSIDRKIKEGNVLGYNKVSAMAEQFSNKSQDAEPKLQKSNTKPAIALPAQGGSEVCHFCNKRVYLMERLSAEGKFFHRGCFRCEYCSTSLRIGNHTFDREKNGGRFYCTQHFGFSGTMKARAEKKRVTALSNKENIANVGLELKTPEKTKSGLEGVVGLDLLDRGQTPERIEFENLAGMSDAEEAQSQMDEDEWTDRNFGASTAEMGSSDDISDMSDSDDNEVYEEAIDQPLTTEGTLELAKNWTLRYSHPNTAVGQSDTGSNEYEDSSDEYTSEDDESGTATEDEEDIRARELRKQEVWLKQPARSSDTDTGSETEVASDEDGSSSESEESEENSATEISTDSEFEHDGATPTQHEIPEITINDSFVRKTRGNYVEPKRVQVKSKVITPMNGNLRHHGKDSVLRQQFKPDQSVVPARRSEKERAKEKPQEKESKAEANKVKEEPKPPARAPLINPRKGDYLLNRTHSTEGIASKLSLELKKKYLLGSSGLAGSVMKSGSASNIDTKLRNLTDAISQHQKLLNPAPEPSPTMQAFLQGTSKLRSSNTQLSPISPTTLFTASPIRAYTVNRSSDSLLGQESKSPFKAIPTDDTSKIQLPDLVKESSILKSKTAPNIVCAEAKNEKDSQEKPQTVGNREFSETVENSQSAVNNGDDFRPRSPLHETSIIVPQVDWGKKEVPTSTGDSEIDSDSLSSSDEDEEAGQNEQLAAVSLSPPRLQIHSTDGDLLLDEEAEKCRDTDESGLAFEPDSIECSFMRDVRPFAKERPSSIELDSIQPVNEPVTTTESSGVVELLKSPDDDYTDKKKNASSCSSPTSTASTVSNKQDDSEENDVTTAALTETEFSEWARDGEALVSDELRDVDFHINPEFITTRRHAKFSDSGARVQALQVRRTPARMAKEEDFNDTEDVCRTERRVELPSNDTSKLLANGENIDFMDTDNESLLEDSLQDTSGRLPLKNRGYVEFVNIKPDQGKTSVYEARNYLTANAPIAKLELENESSEEELQNEKDVIEINPVTMDDVMDKLNSSCKSSKENRPDLRVDLERHNNNNNEGTDEYFVVEALNKELFQSIEEDSLLAVEPTEDTTTSEVITVLASPINPQVAIVPSQSSEMEKEEREEPKVLADSSNPDYLEYVKRLQSRIAEFSNAKDSIDVRKSKRKNSKSSLQPRPTEIITEDVKNLECSPTNNYNSPATSRKLEEITRERSKQKTLIQDLLMDKLEAHKQKSAEKKAKRAARASSFTISTVLSSPKSSTPCTTPISKFVPTSIGPGTTDSPKEKQEMASGDQQVEYKVTGKGSSLDEECEPQVSPPSPVFPIAPPRFKHEEAKKSAEKAKQEARERLKHDILKEKQEQMVERRKSEDRSEIEQRNRKEVAETSCLQRVRVHSVGAIKSPGIKLHTSKSTDNMKALADFGGLSAVNAKSMDELLRVANSAKPGDFYQTSTPIPGQKREKKKPKDPERRRSIIQAVSDFFFKKETPPSPSNNQRDKLSMFRLNKSKGKLFKSYSDGSDLDKIIPSKANTRPKSVCEGMLARNFFVDSPPPIPPPPLNYTISTTQVSEDSLSDEDTKTTAVSMSCGQRANANDSLCNSIPRKSKTTKRIARQAQLKRLRMAQEIQRKLEETEVKQKELENRGVSVEKALRGEGECSDREEADLLREWFDLMKERTELRRYERELLVRAQEVQLEDRHERLQQELRERLADDDDKKTSADVKKEGEILTEMLEIVAKRDSLIALLEEERQRYQDEDRDLEAQMLAKGLRLTPIKKSGPKYSV